MKTQQFFYFIDAKKVFVRVEWKFIKTATERWRWHTFSAVRKNLLYTKQSVTIWMEGSVSSKTPIYYTNWGYIPQIGATCK